MRISTHQHYEESKLFPYSELNRKSVAAFQRIVRDVGTESYWKYFSNKTDSSMIFFPPRAFFLSLPLHVTSMKIIQIDQRRFVPPQRPGRTDGQFFLLSGVSQFQVLLDISRTSTPNKERPRRKEKK